MPINFPKVTNINIILIRPIVFLENRCNLLLILIQIRFRSDCLQELSETDATSPFRIELGDQLVKGVLIRSESVLVEQQDEIVREQDAHPGRIVSIKDLFQVDDILDF